jgi:hypothetical protein
MRAAFVYDYDGTLAKGNIQEASFLPELQIEKTSFWKSVKERTLKEDADEILVYMQLMLEVAKEKGIRITKDTLKDHGGASVLFPGLANGEWFHRINEFARQNDLVLDHYIVSSGIKEMLEGSPISDHFAHIWASKFAYDDNGVACWPAAAINYTTKTQFLFRINKGILNSWDNASVNKYTSPSDRPVPFERMVFFGDGDTDVPTMKMLTFQGGTSIAVYEDDASSREKVHNLISNDRAEFAALADYTENSQMEITAKAILGRMARIAKSKGP